MNELQVATAPGSTLYAVLLDATGRAWNGSAFETLAGANWADYAVPLTEAAAGVYFGAMPAAAAGEYGYIVYEQAGASPATTDRLRGGGSLLWDGAQVAWPALSKDASGRVEVASATAKNTLDSVLAALQGAGWTDETLVALAALLDAVKAKTDNLPASPAATGAAMTLTSAYDAAKTAAPTTAAIDAALSATHGAGAWGGLGSGSGSGLYTDTVADDNGAALDGVRVQLSTDALKTNIAYETYTNAVGVFVLHPDPGTYYQWFDLAGHTFGAAQGAEVVVE